jgi:hypothetical protein
MISVAFLKKLVENTTGGIMAWLEIGLLKSYLVSSRVLGKAPPIESVLQYVFSDCQRHLPRGDPGFKAIVLEGLMTAIIKNKEEAAKTILRAFSLLGYRFNSEETCMGHTATNDSIVQAFDNADWDLTIYLIVEQYLIAVRDNSTQGLKATTSMAYDSGAQQPIARSLEESPQGPSYDQQFHNAIEEKNLVLAYQLLQDYKLSSSCSFRLPPKFVELSVSLGQSEMIVNVIRSTEGIDQWDFYNLVPLLDNGQIAAVSALLIGHPAWKSALNAACYHEDLGTLEAMVFQGSDLPLFEELGHGNSLLIEVQQVIFRVIAFHAIATNNFKLCEWLFQVGMDADELHFCEGEADEVLVVKNPATYCNLVGMGGGPALYIWGTTPSLLAIAAQHNHEEWMEYLLAQGVRSADSGALVWAVKTKASNFPARATCATYTDFLHQFSGNCHYNPLSFESSRAWELFRPTKLRHCCTSGSHPVPRLYHHRYFV